MQGYAAQMKIIEAIVLNSHRADRQTRQTQLYPHVSYTDILPDWLIQ